MKSSKMKMLSGEKSWVAGSMGKAKSLKSVAMHLKTLENGLSLD